MKQKKLFTNSGIVKEDMTVLAEMLLRYLRNMDEILPVIADV
uniref:General transcription factor III repeat domaincontaining protein 2Alike [Acyrthosiphon pisum] n=1 Tax=Lepeophtheirus salmonis TaxID=72036 RepID=A0A0K2VGH9_LEPSM